MSIVKIETDKSVLPGHSFSQALMDRGFVFTQGVSPCRPDTRAVAGPTIAEQGVQVLQNLTAILEEAGLSTRDVLKVTVYMADLNRDFVQFNEIYGDFFGAPFPARTAIGATLWGDYLVQLDAVASVPASDES